MRILRTCAGAALIALGFAIAGRADSLQAPDPSAQPPAITDPVALQVIANEKAGLDALKCGDIASFGKLTADDAVMIDDHGPATKAQVMRNVVNFKLTDYSMDGMAYTSLSPSTGMISYKITEKIASHGKEFIAHAYISSIWTKRADAWVCIFSQETGTR